MLRESCTLSTAVSVVKRQTLLKMKQLTQAACEESLFVPSPDFVLTA